MSALDDLENMVNDGINTMRRITNARGDPAMAANHPKLKELAHRWRVAQDHFRKSMADFLPDEPELGQSEPGSTTASSATPEEVLSSPYAGEEPRHAVQHVERSGTIRPDPIEKAAPTEEAETAGKTDVRDATAVSERQARQEQPKAAASRSDDKKKK